VPKEDYWTDLDQDLPATTADFGADGYTASLSASNQLLRSQLPTQNAVWFTLAEIFLTIKMPFYLELKMKGVEVGGFDSLRNHKHAEGM
jgi:hypothetical protein